MMVKVRIKDSLVHFLFHKIPPMMKEERKRKVR
jgi:hypothetical protein